jgi:hypothetical protein
MPVAAWRHANRQRFNQQKKENYARGRGNVSNERQGWMIHEDDMIIDPLRPCDRRLAKELGRSVQAIQIRRSRLKEKRKRIKK